MSSPRLINNIYVVFISIVTIGLFFILEGHIGFSLQDEGYLWYGVQRVMQGEVPIRDFSSYDPGRYYWSASIMSLLSNDGIMALRGSVAIFQSFGLFVGLFLIIRSIEIKKYNLAYLILLAAILILWMIPRHKLFDISLSIFLIGILTFLIENPTNRRYFLAGLFIGIIAIFGRNHGVYGVAGSMVTMLWLSINRVKGTSFIKGFFLWAAGVIAGYSPILLMLIFVPGFYVSFLDSIRFLFEIKATNLPLPVPWPWQVNFSAPFGEVIYGILVGLFFIAIIVFGLISLMYVTVQRFRSKQVASVLAATSFLALPYAHYAYSRADVAHLAQGIFPFLIGLLVLLSTQRQNIKWSLSIILLVASFWVTHRFHPGWQFLDKSQAIHVKISDNNLIVDPNTASAIELLRKLFDKYAPHGQSFIATPFWPGAYALLERKSPMWETYALFPRSEAFELAEIERIKAAKPAFVFVLDIPLDGRDELRFKNTHPLTYRYFLENFDRIPNTSIEAYQIYKPKIMRE